MTLMLEMMKGAITNAFELESMAISDAMKAYYRGKVMGVIEVAVNGALSTVEHKKIWEHYESEKARFS